jgi:rsbT antagonist protein RsbS
MQRDGIVIQVQSDCVLVTVQKDLDKEFLEVLKTDLLNYCFQKSLKGVILDLSGVAILDSENFEGINKIIHSTRLLGYPCIISGLGAAVVSSLVMSDLDFDGIVAYNSLDQALSHFN